MDTWRDYFKQLLNCEDSIKSFARTDLEPNNNEYPPLSRTEIAQQIKKLKNHKTQGKDRIQGEILKNLNEETILKVQT